ncbi:MAG: ribosome silencing factor [Deltaproteobacteria bacterium]|nr:ribosome silencing factor [Deltaproteobacteria bacterium]
MKRKKDDTKKRVILCVNAALEKKAKNIIILNMQKVTSFTDYSIVCSGNSDRQVQSIAQAIEENMKKNGFLPLGIEGERTAQWILMDYADIIVHVFYEPVRDFYDMERLWSDAPRMEIDNDADRITRLRKGM